MEVLKAVIESLKLGLSRFLRYSYMGFLLLTFAVILEPNFALPKIKEMGASIVILSALVIGAGLYATHRSLIIPLHHLGLCGLFRVFEKIRGVSSDNSSSPTHWLGNVEKIKVPRFFRMYAYSVIRREGTVFEEKVKEKEKLDIAHAENGLIVMTAEGFLIAAIYEWGTPSIVFLLLAIIFLIASYPMAIEQHTLECLKMRKNKEKVEKILLDCGIIKPA